MIAERETPTDMRVTFIDKKNSKYWPAWKLQKDCTIEELNKVNLKSMYHDEIVFDLECKKYKELLLRLEADGITKHKVIDTKSRGFHIHEFFEGLDKHPLELRNEIRKIYIKKYDCDLSKASEITLISISDRPHFKSGEKAELILDVEGSNKLDVSIVEEAQANLEKAGTYVKLVGSDDEFKTYFETDPFWLYVNKIDWTQMPKTCEFNSCVAKNLAIAAVKSGKTKKEIDALLKPFIKKIRGYSYNSFEGWIRSAQGGRDDYNYHEVNQWGDKYGIL